jgi:hypothetical protein
MFLVSSVHVTTIVPMLVILVHVYLIIPRERGGSKDVYLVYSCHSNKNI